MTDRELLTDISNDLKDIKAFFGIGASVMVPKDKSDIVNNIILKFESKRSKRGNERESGKREAGEI